MNRRALIYRFLAPVSSGSLVAALLGGAVILAPPATAAISAAPIGTPCGPSANYGTINYENGVSGTLACVVSGHTGGWSAPSTLTLYDVWIYGGGGGAGGSSDPYLCGSPGSNGNAEEYKNIDATNPNYSSMSWGGGNGGPGADAPNTGSPGSTTYVYLGGGGLWSSAGGAGGNSQNSAVALCTASGNQPTPRSNWPSLGRGGTSPTRPSASGPAYTGGQGDQGGVALSFTPVNPGVATAVSGSNTAGSPGSVDVSWTAPTTNGDWNQRSVVTATSLGSGAPGTCTSTRSGTTAPTSCTVTGLTPGETYEFTVATYTALGAGTGTPSTASASITIPDPPVNATAPTISGAGGKFMVGADVTGTDGTWTGDTITDYSYQWQSCTDASDVSSCSNIAGAMDATYTPIAADAEKFLRIGVTATNQYGSETAYSVLSSSQQITTTPLFTADSPSELAERNFPYSPYTFQASGGRVTYSLSWIDGIAPCAAPGCMDIDPTTGVFSGTPTGAGNDYFYTVTATNDSGSVTSSVFTLSVSDGTPFAISILQQPVGGASGAALGTQPIVRLEDEDGRIILTPTAITASSSVGSTLGGITNPVTTVNGVSTYTDLTLAGTVNTDYFLTFTAGALSATSSALQVTPGAVHSLQIDTQPVASAAAGEPLTTQPVLTVLDAEGNVVNDRPTTIETTSVLSSNTSTAGGSVTGSQAAGLSTTTGVATFTNLAFGGTVGTAYKLRFTSGAISVLSQDVSNTQAGPAAKLSVSTEPTLDGTQLVGTPFATQPVVEVLDTGDNPTTSTATIAATASGGTLGGTTAVAAVSGTSTFTDLTFAGIIATNYTLTFSSPGLTSATSSNFQFANPSQVGPVSTATSTITSSDAGLAADGTDTATITVQMKDAGGNNLTSSQGTVALTATTGTLGGVTDNNDGTYTATYTSPSSRGTGQAVISGTLGGAALTETASIALYTTQTITFTQPADVPLGALPYQLTASASSGLTPAFTSATTSVCTVTSGGIVTILTVGSCTINVDQSGNAVYWPATQVSQTFAVQATTPTAPFITSVTPGNGQATVTFTAPGFDGGAAISDYEFSIDDGASWTSAGVSTSPLTVPGLVNDTAYVVLIRAVNSAGAGLASAGSPSVTPAGSGPYTPLPVSATVPSAPRNVQVVAEPSTTAIVSWSEPRSNGGAAISAYTVTVSPSATCTATLDATAGTGTCTASSLTPGQTYVFTVRAVNSVGPGDTATVRYTVPGGGGGGGGTGGGGGGGGGATGGDDDPSRGGDDVSDSGGDSGGSGGTGGSGGPRPPFPPNVPTPDGPSDEDIEDVLKKPSTGSISELPTLPIVKGTGPMPGGNPTGDSGLRAGMKGVKVMPTVSAELAAALAAGAQVSMASGTAQVGYLTSRKITIAPGTMLQVVTSLEPDDQQLAFRLWMQDRTGAWFRMGRTTTVDGQVVFPVMQFDTPGTYQVIATSVSGPRAVDADGNPVFGSTTVRTIVIVTPRQALGTKVCPNMVSFDQRSALLSKASKRQIRKLAECLGAMPAIKVSGYVGQAVRPAAAKRMAYLRARNVRNYLRELGYDGGAKIRTSIEQRPVSCESTGNRCALVRLELGTERASERAAWDLVATPKTLDDGVAAQSGGADAGSSAQASGEPAITASVDSGGHDPTQLQAQEST